MKQEQQQAIALMRYGAIAPLVTGLDDRYPSMQAYYEEVSAKGLTGPDGRNHHFAPSTIERWYLDYKKRGFDSLIPAARADAGKSRKLDHDIQEQIRYLKSNYPRMSAAAIHRQLSLDGAIAHGQVSESTVCRFLKQLALENRQSQNRDMRRYERPHINEVWCGDSCFGPKFTDADGKKHRLYLIALIDDASRFIVGINIFYQDNFVNLMAVMKAAVSKYGRPKVFNFDNGKSYRNRQMELLAARIGTTLNYCQPYTPTSKAKIERWFRTMKDQWMASLDMQDFHSLEEIRGCLFLMCSAITSPPTPPSMESPHRIVSFPNRNRSGVCPEKNWKGLSFWKWNAGFPLIRLSSSTRWNTRWTAASPGSASGCVIPPTCRKSTLWNRTGRLPRYVCSTNRKTPS